MLQCLDRFHHSVMDNRGLTENALANAISISRKRFENILQKKKISMTKVGATASKAYQVDYITGKSDIA